MRVVFRVDASFEIGSGHLMRCLTLANSLRPIAKIIFIFRFMMPDLVALLRERNYGVHQLPHSVADLAEGELKYSHWLGTTQQQDALDTRELILAQGGCDWLVIDHYSLDQRFESQLRPFVGKILVIDDLADRNHDCDVLVDQNPFFDMDIRYRGRVPDYCLCMLGTRYCFLRDEFLLQHANMKQRGNQVRSVLIYFGGVDSENHTQDAVEVLLLLKEKDISQGRLTVNVVVGSLHPALNNLRKICEKFSMNFYVQTGEMARLMSESDLAIGAGGVSTFERLYLRLPSLLIPIADNQREPLRFMASLGFFKIYQSRLELQDLLRDALIAGLEPPPDCVENGMPLLVNVLRNGTIKLNRPCALDIRRTFYWLQDTNLRRDFNLSSRPTRAQHFFYWRKLLSSDDQRVFAIYHEEQHVGNCGLKNIDLVNSMCELWIYLGVVNIRGKGVAKLAVKALQRFARQELSVDKLCLHVSRHNAPAFHLYVSTGFVESQEKLSHPWENSQALMQKMECVL